MAMELKFEIRRRTQSLMTVLHGRPGEPVTGCLPIETQAVQGLAAREGALLLRIFHTPS